MYRTILSLSLALSVIGCKSSTGPNGSNANGKFSGSFVETDKSTGSPSGSTLTCRYTINVTGTVKLDVETKNGNASGDGTIAWVETAVVKSLDNGCNEYSQGGNPRSYDVGGDVTGTTGEFHVSGGYTDTKNVTVTTSGEFVGHQQGNGLVGRVTLTRTGSGTIVNQTPSGPVSTTTTSNSSGTFDVTPG